MANSDIIYPQLEWSQLSRLERLEKLDEYYSNNDLYETTRLLAHWNSVWKEDIRPLRTPVHRSVEFYVAKIAIGDPMVSAGQGLSDAIKSILDWSNFNTVKPNQVRHMSKYGGIFRKVVSSNGKVWHEMVETKDVSAVKHDTRGFLTEIRIDTPIVEDGIDKFRTEFWTVNDNVPYMAVWVHRRDRDTDLDELGTPLQFLPLSAFGIDFVPFEHSRFQDDGGWGVNCVEHALLKVDEANRQATRLHQMLFRYNKPLWAVSANQVAEDGSPIPAPKMKQGTNAAKTNIDQRDNSIFYLPGLASIDSLVPQIDYKAALEILKSQEAELREDLPELQYYSAIEKVGANVSGKSLKNMLGAAVDRAVQAQANYVEGTIRLNQMAITIGQFQGIFPSGIGSFDAGTTQHSLKFAEQFPLDGKEKADTLKVLTESGIPLKIAMGLSGFTEEEVALVPDVAPQPPQPPRSPSPPEGEDMEKIAQRMMR